MFIVSTSSEQFGMISMAIDYATPLTAAVFFLGMWSIVWIGGKYLVCANCGEAKYKLKK